jgi:hypothetical protein
MPEKEQKPHIPRWAERERHSDMAWIGENLSEFWNAARQGFNTFGRGAVAVDTLVQPAPDKGHPMYYVPQELIDQHGSADEIRLVTQYDPSWEFVAMLFKEENKVSSYRVGVPNQRQ